jgi:hypothetical protein
LQASQETKRHVTVGFQGSADILDGDGTTLFGGKIEYLKAARDSFDVVFVSVVRHDNVLFPI